MTCIKTLVSLFCAVELCVIPIFNNYFYVTRAASRHYIFGDEDSDMAILLGKIDEFDRSKEEWPQYVERLGHFFDANDITSADKKRSVFLAVVGPTTYKLLHNLLAPDKQGDKSYTKLVTTLTNHFNPTPSEAVQRYKFNTSVRKLGESVSTYISELRSLAEHCNYGASLETTVGAGF